MRILLMRISFSDIIATLHFLLEAVGFNCGEQLNYDGSTTRRRE
ncbi:hypothetical protein THF1C08_200090 [Vibrio jasicida]|nr:hypothetical protein THF1C08_200090 [Vibrio jasicida]